MSGSKPTTNSNEKTYGLNEIEHARTIEAAAETLVAINLLVDAVNGMVVTLRLALTETDERIENQLKLAQSLRDMQKEVGEFGKDDPRTEKGGDS